MSESITHRCPDGSTRELPRGRFLPDAQEFRTECDECGAVYHNGETEHE